MNSKISPTEPLHSALLGVSAETVAELVREFDHSFPGDAGARPEFGAWLTMSPLERHTLTAHQLLAAESLKEVYELHVASVPSAHRTVLGWFWTSYSSALRQAGVLGKENQRLRQLAGADKDGPIPAPRHLRAIHIWAWADVPVRLEVAAPPGPTPAWALLYPCDLDSELVAAVRKGLQSIPHGVCVRTVGRRRAEFLW